MKQLFPLLILLCLINMANAQTKPYADLHLIKPGMSESEVKKLIGEPDKEKYYTINKITHDTNTYWDYAPEQTVYFTQHKVTHVDYHKDAIKERIRMSIEKNNREGKNTDTTRMSPQQKEVYNQTLKK